MIKVEQLKDSEDKAYGVSLRMPIDQDGKEYTLEYKFSPSNAILMGIGLITTGIHMGFKRFIMGKRGIDKS